MSRKIEKLWLENKIDRRELLRMFELSAGTLALAGGLSGCAQQLVDLASNPSDSEGSITALSVAVKRTRPRFIKHKVTKLIRNARKLNAERKLISRRSDVSFT
jgi:hypothetical protein